MASNRSSGGRARGDDAAVEKFIAKWLGQEGGQERANYALFLTELCDALGVARPEPASAEHDANDYVFERVVQETGRDGIVSNRRIDLYKRDCFVLEAKQSRQKGGDKEVRGQADMFVSEAAPRGRRGAERAWDVLMLNARRQAEDYVRLLPSGHEPPPFVLVCDVGHCFEIYANFRRDGKAFDQFPDRRSYRIYLEDLRRDDVRETLQAIWTDPLSLDPARRSARVTRDIAKRLAAVSKALEKQSHPPEEVAMFLMRCLFTMFAEDVGLLPEDSFEQALERCEREPETFQHDIGQLWEAMNIGGYAHALRKKVARFNGEFFLRRSVLPLGREEIGELRQAASYDWRDVDPAIFGTLLEQALDPNERRRLGAHFTPRAYVERLVVATMIEPLREDWGRVVSTAERQKSEGRLRDAIATVRAFHDQLCATRVLDPACGTGNFLYVSLELLKRLEGEVLEALADLGGQEALIGLEGHTVDPHQFLGLEINPRAAAIAELVLWIGHLQWHVRTKGGMPSEPILRAFKNIVVKDAVLEADKVLKRDDKGKPVTRAGPDGELVEVYEYKNPRRPDYWPPAEFIVGNPPFIGGKDLRARLGDHYVEELWSTFPHMNDSADYVMYWWDSAAELLIQDNTPLRRFGFVTTNSISQIFLRRAIEQRIQADKPVSIVMAIPDHPWRGNGKDNASVRIAMTVAEVGAKIGLVREVSHESGLDTDAPIIEFVEKIGKINPDLTVGVDVSTAVSLRANSGLCSNGMKPLGKGFWITPATAEQLGLGKRHGLHHHIRPYRNGRDLTSHARGVLALDFYGLTSEQLRSEYPEAYQYLATTVKPEREASARKSRTKDAQEYAQKWWLFCKPRQEMRDFLASLHRFAVTVQTAKHRVFQFLDASFMPDQKLMVFGMADAYDLGVLSSRFHTVWTLRTCGWQGVGNDPVYVKTKTFDCFTFPVSDDLQKQRIRAVAEELDAHRKRVLAEHPHLTLTGLYNVLERLREGVAPDALAPAERRIFDDGLVLILKELHDRLDAAVADAYGWPADLSDDDILARLVALNKERAAEEGRGLVRWLRPDYQIPRFGAPQEREELELVGAAARVETKAAPKPSFPAEEVAQTAAVMSALATASGPLDAVSLAAGFKQGRRVAPKVAAVLAALARMGFVDSLDGGRTFMLRRAA